MDEHGTLRRAAGPWAHLLGMTIGTPTRSDLEPLLSIEELAEYLDIPVSTIRDWRTDGKGPRAIRLGGRLRFAVSDVRTWLGEQREISPGQTASGW